ncbi:MAG: hypothetical protein WBN96_10590 [Gammaproteobacteria bacterium]
MNFTNNSKLLHKTIRSAYVLALTVMFATSAGVSAASDNEQTLAGKADSVYNWGSWELGLEPAAGGPIALPNRALSNRPASVRFRPSDNSVYSASTRTLAETTMGPTPAPPVVPLTNGPGTAPPGGPGDRF